MSSPNRPSPLPLRKLVKRIYFVGPHSTGKTTLVNELLTVYEPSTLVLKETARQVLKAKQYTAKDIESPRCLSMQRDILQAQYRAEEALIGQYGDWVPYISDRAGVDPIVYAKKYAPGVEEWKELCGMEEWKALAHRYRDKATALVILVNPTKAFLKDDGTRKMPLNWEEWLEFGQIFSEFLEVQGIPFKEIGESCPDLKERVARVVGWVG